jgi:response regulator RpfG family c-di-GMP phosphodiesterase
MNEQARILCVDDEPNVLDGLRRSLRRSYDVVVALGGEAGIQALHQQGPFAVVISDQRMPGVDGVAFLEHVHQRFPDTIRILLTGFTHVDAAIAAVNRGAVFRFLTKPCPQEVLESAIAAGVEQHRLVTAERVLLEQTLHGSIRALTDVLALVHPAGFGRAARAKSLAADLVANLGYLGGWQIEIAAMLSQIGTVTLPSELVEKHYGGKPLMHAERAAVERLPRIAGDLVANIPRMEEVRDILYDLGLRYDGVGTQPGRPVGDAIPWQSRLLRLVLDLDLLESQGMQRTAALAVLRDRQGWYDPALYEALVSLHGEGDSERQVLELELGAIRPGMVFAEDVHSTTGILLIARGQEVSERLVERVRNLLHLVERRQLVRVLTPRTGEEPSAPPSPMAVA